MLFNEFELLLLQQLFLLNIWELSIQQKVRRRKVILHLKCSRQNWFQFVVFFGDVRLRTGKTILIKVHKALELQLSSLLQFCCVHEVIDKVYNTTF